MKHLIKNIALLSAFAGLTSCVAYQDGYADNNRYYDPYYSGGYYYAPQSYYGAGGYYGNDGYYYRNDMNYYYDNGAPYYMGRNNTKIYVVRQNSAGDRGNTNTATFRNNNSVQNPNTSNIRTQNSSNRGFRTPSAPAQNTTRNQGLRVNPVPRTQAPAQQPAQNQSGFRNGSIQPRTEQPAGVNRTQNTQTPPAGTRGSR